MKRTSPVLLCALGVLGLVAGYAVQQGLAAASLAKLQPEYSFAASLLLIGVILVGLAIPVRRSTRGPRRARVDPFYATRVVMLAKASSLVAAVLGGAGLGLLAELLSHAVTPGASLGRTIAMIVASLLLLVGALVAEHLCTVPPEGRDDDSDDDTAAPAA